MSFNQFEKRNRTAVLRDSWPVNTALDSITMLYWRFLARSENDLFLCSYPKSGRTWLRFLLTHYQIRLCNADYSLNLRNFAAVSPNFTLVSEFRLRDLPDAMPIRRLLGTHSELPFLFRGLQIIFLCRDIRDVLVSFYYHRLARREFQGDLDSFVWSPWGLRHVIRYHNRWCRALGKIPDDNVLELSYERLHVDPSGTVRDCLRFMDLPIDDALVDEAVVYAGQCNMRKLESRWGTLDFSTEDLSRDSNAYHVRGAQVGSYREELAPHTQERISRTLRRELVDCRGYNY